METPPEIIPLLRFSLSSLAANTQWTKHISEACKHCDTEEFVPAEIAASLETEKRKRREEGFHLLLCGVASVT